MCLKGFPLIFLSIVFTLQASASGTQIKTRIFTDFGANNVSDGMYWKAGDILTLSFGSNNVEAGFQFDMAGGRERKFSGFGVSYSRQLQVSQVPLEVSGFYIMSPFSDILREYNTGVALSLQSMQFSFLLGTNFRTYAYNKSAIEQYGLETSTRLQEKWNLTYNISYQIKPTENRWNLILGITNLDIFLINQETNPMLRITGTYEHSGKLRFFLDGVYKQAGMFNINVHYFGFVLRPGIIWHIN